MLFHLAFSSIFAYILVSDNNGGVVPIFTVYNTSKKDIEEGNKHESDEELWTEMHRLHASRGGEVSRENPHTYRLSESRVCALARIRDAKVAWDPKNLLNPGKASSLEE
jgi:FAD/FMN-containing dehydrogenase